MTGNAPGAFAARPGDADRWIRAGEPAAGDRPTSAFTARLTAGQTTASPARVTTRAEHPARR